MLHGERSRELLTEYVEKLVAPITKRKDRLALYDHLKRKFNMDSVIAWSVRGDDPASFSVEGNGNKVRITASEDAEPGDRGEIVCVMRDGSGNGLAENGFELWIEDDYYAILTELPTDRWLDIPLGGEKSFKLLLVHHYIDEETGEKVEEPADDASFKLSAEWHGGRKSFYVYDGDGNVVLDREGEAEVKAGSYKLKKTGPSGGDFMIDAYAVADGEEVETGTR